MQNQLVRENYGQMSDSSSSSSSNSPTPPPMESEGEQDAVEEPVDATPIRRGRGRPRKRVGLGQNAVRRSDRSKRNKTDHCDG